jgi:DNA modification methylase
VPEPPVDPVTVLGDVWVMGPHRVACGDATAITTWDALMRGELADCVWTDPPYNVAYESKLAGKIKNDDMGDAEFLELLRGSFASLFSVIKPGASIYVAHADTEGLNFRRAFRESGFKLSGCLIWKKNALVLGRSDYQWIHEPILYGWKPGSKHRWYGGRKQVTVQDLGDSSPFTQQADGSWLIRVGDQTLVVSGDAKVQGPQPTSVMHHEKPRRSAEHPTMKPVTLIERMLAFSARSGDLIVDAFGGSGSTLIAAERLGMCARVTELDPKFVDVIVKRWQDYTGRQATLESTGQTFEEVAAQRG